MAEKCYLWCSALFFLAIPVIVASTGESFNKHLIDVVTRCITYNYQIKGDVTVVLGFVSHYNNL